MSSQATTTVTPKGRISDAEIQRLDAIIETGRAIKRLRDELKAHDAKRDTYRVSIVQRIEAAELKLIELTDGKSVTAALREVVS